MGSLIVRLSLAGVPATASATPAAALLLLLTELRIQLVSALVLPLLLLHEAGRAAQHWVCVNSECGLWPRLSRLSRLLHV